MANVTKQSENKEIAFNVMQAIPEFLNGAYAEIIAEIQDKRKEIESSLSALSVRRTEVEALIEQRLREEQARLEAELKKQQEIENERAGLMSAAEEAVVEETEPAAVDEKEKTEEVKEAETDIPVVAEPVVEEVKKPMIKFYIPEENPMNNRQRYQRPAQPTGTGAPSRYNQKPDASARPVAPVMPPISSTGGKKKGVPEKTRSVFDDKKGMSKKAQISRGYLIDSSAVEYDEETGEIIKIRTRKFGDKDKNNNQNKQNIDVAIINTPTLTVKQLSEKIGHTGAEIIKILFDMQITKTINDFIDFETACLVGMELNITIEQKAEQTSEEKLIAIHDEDGDDDNLKPRPPIVTIMGHVDHGKTSILDYIRSSHVASGEAGGITQHIGAYEISLEKGGSITFLDTPGHEAFTSMRMRGANVTDIAVIVVAADDGIMPQTVEAINHAKAAGVEIVIAINKMDKAGANPDKVLQQLSNYDLLVEDWGGTVPVVRVSAKTGENIDKLLDTILLVAEIMDLKANPDRQAKGAIIEARLDKGMGPVATVLVQNGTLRVGDYIIADAITGRVRAMFSDSGKEIKSAGPSVPVSVLGFQEVPSAGEKVMSTKDISLVRKVSEMRERNKTSVSGPRIKTLEEMLASSAEQKLTQLNIIIKGDVQGSVEAVKQALEKLSNDEVKIRIMHSGVGAINESDIMLAKTDYTIVIGFNVRPDNKAKQEAEKAKIDIRTYRIIYDVIDDISRAVQGLLSPKFNEKYMGRAEVRQVFRINGVGNIAGCMVKDGKIVRGAKVRLLREGVIVCEGEISSLKHEKNDVKEVATSWECGIGILNYNDISEGDVIESFVLEQVEV